jgi:outer membrane lipoprotein carrier protein
MKTVLIALIAALTWPLAAWANGLQQLEAFLKDIQGARANFTQVVTSPPKAGDKSVRAKSSSGRFEFVRPDRFRFDYTKPFVQTIVADGKTLWLYDADLNQVTVRNQKDTLGATPATLIAAGSDLKALRESFELSALPDREGMSWVEARPRQKDGQLHSIKAAFKGTDLAILEIADGLGQVSVMTFSGWQSNPAMAADRFRFQVPAGADVLRP